VGCNVLRLATLLQLSDDLQIWRCAFNRDGAGPLGSAGNDTRELGGECNQSCQQYRSDNGISPKPTTKHFLIVRIELFILIESLPANRPLPQTNKRGRIVRAKRGGDV